MAHTQTVARKGTENPFFAMVGSLNMLQNVSKLADKPPRSVVFNYLNDAWKECKDDLMKRQMFFSILFSFGDVTDREHNIFKKSFIKEPLAGGKGLRRVFLYCLEWMHINCKDQFYKFLPLYGEYYNLGGATMFDILWTDRWKGTVTDRHKIAVDVDTITEFIASALKDRNITDNELRLWAKWLWHVPSGKRKRKFVVTDKGLKSVHKKYNKDAKVGDVITRVGNKLSETQEKDKFVVSCINSLSKKMGWEEKKHGSNTQYVGYNAFRSKYLGETEAVLFSTGRIRNMDKAQLLTWFDSLPGGARHRVQRRIVEKTKTDTLIPRDKWVTTKGLNVGEVYMGWLKGKEDAQKAIRSLSVEDKEKMAKEQPDQLKKMERAAKINVGGESLIDVVVNMFTKAGTTQEANLKAHSLLEQMKLLVPVLIAADISGSTSGRPIVYKGVTFTPQGFIKLLVTVFLLKNPDPDLADMFIRFDDQCDIIADGAKTDAGGTTKYMGTSVKTVDKLIDRTADFVTNFNSVSQWIISRNSTHFNVIADGLKRWVDSDPVTSQIKIDMINKYPVFLCLSDGDLNYGTPASTILDFQSKMRQWFGWEGVVVIWDVNMKTQQKTAYSGLTNVIHYVGFDVSMVTAIFTNLHDLDVIDIYTVLDAMFKSNRYQPVRDLVL